LNRCGNSGRANIKAAREAREEGKSKLIVPALHSLLFVRAIRAIKNCSQGRISGDFHKADAEFFEDLRGEYRLCNFFENFSCHHNMLGIRSVCCPLNGVLSEIGRMAKSWEAGQKVDFPDRFSVLRRSGDLSEMEFQPS
jgi:hypothetical protein